MIKKILSVILCSVIFSLVLVRDVKAVGVEVATGITIIIGGILGGLGVTTINGMPSEEFINGNSIDKNVFMNDFYNSLSTNAKAEIKSKVSSIVPGETFTFNMSNRTIKEIYNLILKNSTALDEGDPNDSRNFKFSVPANMKSNQPSKWLSHSYVDKFGFKKTDRLGYFEQFTFLGSDTISGTPSVDQGSILNSYGVMRTNTRVFRGSGDFPLIGEMGYTLENCVILTRTSSLHSLSPDDIPYAEKVVGSFTNSQGKKIDIKCKVSTYYSGEHRVRVSLSGFGVSIGSGVALNEFCRNHGLIHDQFFALYILKDSNGRYYYSYGRLSFSFIVDSECGYGISCPAPFDSDYSEFSSDFAQSIPFEIVVDESLASIGTAVGGLDDEKGILVNIPITNDSAIDLPTDKSEIMDMTGAGTVEKPDFDIDIPDLDVPKIFTKFPFSIPYDIYNVFFVLNATPVTPKWTVPIVDAEIEIDFSQFDSIAKVVRWVFYLIFVYGLIQKTRTLIKG